MDKIAQAYASGLINPGEFWLSIPRFPDYLVGAHGEVISMLRAPRKLRPIRLGSYTGFQLRDADGNRRKAYLHRLVTEVVYGPCPDGMECCHNDGSKANNDFSNLRWDTHANNEADRARHGTTAAGENSGTSKLTWAQVNAMREMRESTGAFYREIAEAFGVSTMTAYRAITGQSWSK